MKFSDLQKLQRKEGITVVSSDYRIELLEARLSTIAKERDTLRAELDALNAWKAEAEKQEPVAWRWKYRFKDIGETGAYEYHSHDSACVAMMPHGEPLYPNPISPAPSVLKITRDFKWVSEKRHHIPTLILEFTPVPANSPNDGKGWKDRDNLAVTLTSAPKQENLSK